MEVEEGREGWTVEGELGRGSFGSVYLLVHRQARPSATVSKYALKIIDEHGARKGDKEEARKELRIMRGLFHPNIVDLVDAFELQQQIHLVLELCEGGDLRTYLDQLRKRRARDKRLTTGVEESLVLLWTKQLSSALTYLHHKKILHRDLKPQNIFLKDQYTLKVGDLGIARQLRFTLEMAATHIGTPLYISPEIYQGTPYSYKSDIWSLGCCVYEMMALQCAFQAASRYEVMWKVVSKELGPVPPCYSPELRALTITMLSKDPEERPSANQVLDVAQSMLQQQERPPWEAGVDKDVSPTRPADTKSLQMWRQDMANALIKYLSEKHAIHSAGLAELALRLSKGSIEGSDEDFTSTISQSQPQTRVSTSSRGAWDSSVDHYTSNSCSGSDSEQETTVTLQTSRTDDASENGVSAADAVHKSPFTRGVLRRSAFKVKHGQSPDIKRKKTKDGPSDSGDHAPRKRHERGLGGDHSESLSLAHSHRHHGNPDASNTESMIADSDVTCTTRHPAEMHKAHGKARMGKLSSGHKSRPLPVPRGFSNQEEDTDVPSHDHVQLENPSDINRGVPKFPLYENLGAPLLNKPSGNPGAPSDNLSVPLFIDVSSDPKPELYLPPPGEDQREAQAAYAKGVAEMVRFRLGEVAPVEIVPQGGGDADEAHVPAAEMLEGGAARDESEQQVPSKGDRARRKKRNFLRERTAKQQNGQSAGNPEPSEPEPVSQDKPCGKEEAEDAGVTLYTRGQRVSFTNSKEPASPTSEDELEGINKRHSVTRVRMSIELGETTFQAALNTAQLLKNNPSLLEVQLRDLLGRENYKKFAAAIVDCVESQTEKTS